MRRKIFITLLINCSFLYADVYQPLGMIQDKIEQYLLQHMASETNIVKVKVDNLDTRLKLKSCHDHKLEIFNPHKGSLDHISTMGARCLEPDNHWTVYVPVNINLLKRICAVKHPINKGAIIRASDIELIEVDVRQLKNGYFIEAEPIIGSISNQFLAAGTPLNATQMHMPKLVYKGQQVSIMAGNELFSVKMMGVALEDGALGDSISVRNLSSKRNIDVSVSGAQQVKVLN